MTEAEPERTATVAGVIVTSEDGAAGAVPSARVVRAAREDALGARRGAGARRAAGAPTKAETQQVEAMLRTK